MNSELLNLVRYFDESLDFQLFINPNYPFVIYYPGLCAPQKGGHGQHKKLIQKNSYKKFPFIQFQLIKNLFDY